MWLLIVCFIHFNIFYSSINGEVISNSSCQSNSESGSIYDESSTVTPSQGSCFVSPLSSGILVSHDKKQSNPRYSRAILSSNTRIPQNPSAIKLGITEENDQEEYNRGPRTMQHSTQNTFNPQANFGREEPSGQELADARGSFPEQVYSRPLYPTSEGSFIPPISHQGNFPSMTFNHGTPPNHAFGGRSCPFCNSPLPSELMYQRQMSKSLPHEFHQNPLVNQFSHQYSMLQGREGYDNINPVVKTSPTLATEEMCPYDDGPPDIVSMSPSMTYNRTLQQARESPGSERYSPVADNTSTPPAYYSVKNVPFTHSHGQAEQKTMAGVPFQQNYKGTKVQRSEIVKKKVGFNGNM